MSKAILVLDEMPECCDDCIAYSEEFCGCKLKGKEIHFEYRPDWCPLREAPTKARVWDENGDDYYRGYNAAIDEILGGDSNE